MAITVVPVHNQSALYGRIPVVLGRIVVVIPFVPMIRVSHNNVGLALQGIVSDPVSVSDVRPVNLALGNVPRMDGPVGFAPVTDRILSIQPHLACKQDHPELSIL